MNSPASAAQTDEKPLRPKALQALAAAKVIFLESGFDAATMDAIAREAGISKATLYAYFAGKEELFEALIRNECRAVNARLYVPDLENESVAAELEKVATNFRRLFTQKQGLDLYRIIVPVAPRFPRLAQVFYEEGPGTSLGQCTRYFEALNQSGRLRTPDPEIAARQFLALVTEDLKLSGALALPGPGPIKADALMASGIEMLLAYYKA